MATILKLVNGVPRMVDFSTVIYDQVYVVASPITSGTSITLPASGTYTSTELKVELNGQLLEAAADYNYVGSAPRTQVQMTFDLEVGDRLRFRLGD